MSNTHIKSLESLDLFLPSSSSYNVYSFHCRIFNMSPEKIKERSDFLIQFLDLPNKWRLVVNLSGGQQRLVMMLIFAVNIMSTIHRKDIINQQNQYDDIYMNLIDIIIKHENLVFNMINIWFNLRSPSTQNFDPC